jgi:hypothetical protein
VTIVPSFGFSSILRLTADPGDRIKHYIVEGERATWPKLAMVRNRRLIEIELAAWEKAHEKALLPPKMDVATTSGGGEHSQTGSRSSSSSSPDLSPGIVPRGRQAGEQQNPSQQALLDGARQRRQRQHAKQGGKQGQRLEKVQEEKPNGL